MRVLRQGHYSENLVRLLANTYLVMSDSAAAMSLENKLALVKPKLVDRNALIFGTARILARDYAGAAQFFGEKAKLGKGETAAWARWYHGFALLLDKRYAEAAEGFVDMVKTAETGVLIGLSAYFLAEPLRKVLPSRSYELMAAAMDGRNRVRSALPSLAAWTREIEKIRSEVYAAVLSKYIDEASDWLYIKEFLL
jgi:hypothetical protein